MLTITDYLSIATLAFAFMSTVGVAWLRLYIRDTIHKHELQDERRHRQNLMRFGWIGISFTKLAGKVGMEITDMPNYGD